MLVWADTVEAEATRCGQDAIVYGEVTTTTRKTAQGEEFYDYVYAHLSPLQRINAPCLSANLTHGVRARAQN